MSPTILTVPGLGGSGPSHWQTLWEQARPDTVRVELGMWNTPHRNAWVTRLDEAIRRAEAPVVLAAHSLGCLAVAWWAQLSPQPYGWPVAGALLVAPADADRQGAQAELRRSPRPRGYRCRSRRSWSRRATIPGCRSSARTRWRRTGASPFVDAGPQGHLKAASGIGWRREGQALLDRVLLASCDRTGHARAPGDARAILAVNATDAAQAHYLGS